jgi:hypothetical protein
MSDEAISVDEAIDVIFKEMVKAGEEKRRMKLVPKLVVKGPVPINAFFHFKTNCKELIIV